jgi:hypothetical protein
MVCPFWPGLAWLGLGLAMDIGREGWRLRARSGWWGGEVKLRYNVEREWKQER